ncbi:MAG: hypothetical protein ACFCUX_02245 [Candidatus Methylacidiphilales bacterium]
MIEVHPIEEETYAVTCMADNPAEYVVTLEDEYYLRITDGNVLPEELVEHSVVFFMDRAKMGAEIPERFDVSTMAMRYPEFEAVIRQKLRR